MAKRRPALTGTNLEIAGLTEIQEEARRLGISLRTRDGFQKQRSSLLKEIQTKTGKAAEGRARRAAELGTARRAIGERLSGTQEMLERAGVKAGSRTPGAQMTFTDYVQGQQAKVMKGSASSVAAISKELGPLPPSAQARRKALLDASRTMKTPATVQAAPPAAAPTPVRQVAQSGAPVQGQLRTEYVRARMQRRDEARYTKWQQGKAEERMQARQAATDARRSQIQREYLEDVNQRGTVQQRQQTARQQIAASRPERLATAERLRTRGRYLPKSRLGAIFGLGAMAIGGTMAARRMIAGPSNEADIETLAMGREAFRGPEPQIQQAEEQLSLMNAAAYAGETRASLQSLVAGHEQKLAQIQQSARSSVVAQMAALGII